MNLNNIDFQKVATAFIFFIWVLKPVWWKNIAENANPILPISTIFVKLDFEKYENSLLRYLRNI